MPFTCMRVGPWGLYHLIHIDNVWELIAKVMFQSLTDDHESPVLCDNAVCTSRYFRDVDGFPFLLYITCLNLKAKAK